MEPSRPTPVDIAQMAADNGRADLRGAAATLLLIQNDHDFLSTLTNMIRIRDSPYPTQEGPLLLQQPGILARVAEIRRDTPGLFEGLFAAALRPDRRFDLKDIAEKLTAFDIGSTSGLQHPQSGSLILMTDYPPPRYFVAGMLHQGLTLLAGKMKRGKSYLALNMAMDIACGRRAFQTLPTSQTPVLYASLEDREPLLQRRMKLIQPNITDLPGLDFVLTFPMLGEGALEAMQHYHAQRHYGVIIIDTIGRITPEFGSLRKQMNEYTKITHLLGPVQQWANAAHVAVVMIDHVRKAEADDIFDTVMGTSAKMGIADHGIVYQRKDYDPDAMLHMRGRWIGDDKIVLTMVDGHLEFLGQGETYDLSREQRQVLKALEDDGLPMKIGEIMASVGVSPGQYARFKKVLQRMLRDGLIDRTGHGAYCALKRADYDDSDFVPSDEKEWYR